MGREGIVTWLIFYGSGHWNLEILSDFPESQQGWQVDLVKECSWFPGDKIPEPLQCSRSSSGFLNRGPASFCSPSSPAPMLLQGNKKCLSQDKGTCLMQPPPICFNPWPKSYDILERESFDIFESGVQSGSPSQPVHTLAPQGVPPEGL